MDWLDILLCNLIALIVWLIFVFIFLLVIYSQVKEKNRKKYSFFSNCWIKKMFLIGLNGGIKRSIIVFTFIINVSLCLALLLGIWCSIIPTSSVAQFGYRIVYVIYGICFMVRLILMLGVSPKFK